MKNLMALAVTALMGIQNVYADNLSGYRQSILKTVSNAGSLAKQRSQKIKTQIGMNSVLINGFENKKILSGVSKHHRLYSSITFKNILQNGISTLLLSEKYGTPLVHDPSWTQEEQHDILKLHRRRLCINGLMKSHSEGGKFDGINKIVNDVSEVTYQRKEEINNEAGAELSDEQNKLAKIIEAHLKIGPMNSKNQSIFDMLGSVQKVNLVDGLVHKVYLSKDSKTLETSLTMVLTYRLGEDDAFVELQECLVEYLNDQKKVFTERKNQLQAGVFVNAWNGAVGEFMKLFSFNKNKIISSSENKEAVTKEMNDLQQEVMDKNPEHRFEKQLAFFHEGNKFDDSVSELKSIDSRLNLLSKVLPFLIERLALAKETNLSLKQLSRTQVNYLVDMFLQMRGEDIPTNSEAAILGASFSAGSNNLDVRQSDTVNADYMFYRTLAEQLTSLENLLVEEDSNAKAKMEDLNEIYERRR